MNRPRVLVTGASGFIGAAFLARAHAEGRLSLRAAMRKKADRQPDGIESIVVEGLTENADWYEAVCGCDAVIHTAARVHVMHDVSNSPLQEFRRVNVAGTLALARQAANAGVRRFVFLSSIGVNGAETFSIPFSPEDKVAPHSPYTISKYEAEMGLREIAQETGLELVIIRPPLVYGPGAPGNFHKLLQLVYKGVPLPLGAIHNQRSLVALDNLLDLLIISLYHAAAINQTFLVSDGEDISTTDLIRRMAEAFGKAPRLFPMPARLLRTTARLLGKSDLAQRLCGSLQVDIRKTRELLGWSPPVRVDDALKQTIRHFLSTRDG